MTSLEASLEAVLDDDPAVREHALVHLTTTPLHERSALGHKLGHFASETATLLAAADLAGQSTSALASRLARACVGLASVGVDSAKSYLLRIADEGSPGVRKTLADALRATTSAEGRSVLVYLLSDDDTRPHAIVAIGAAPWPEVLPILIEIAEADDYAARLAAEPIARCGAAASPSETNAAADFLLEQLDDEKLVPFAAEALLRFGRSFPGVVMTAQRLVQEAGKRKIASLCLLAARTEIDDASLCALANAGTPSDPEVARPMLAPWVAATDPHLRRAAMRTWTALALPPIDDDQPPGV